MTNSQKIVLSQAQIEELEHELQENAGKLTSEQLAFTTALVNLAKSEHRREAQESGIEPSDFNGNWSWTHHF